MALGRIRREAAEHHAADAARRVGDLARHGADRDARRAIGREAVDAGRDRRKGDRGEPVLGRERERGAVAGGEQLLLALAAAAPDRPDRVDHVPGRKPIAAGDLGGAGGAAAERAALGDQFRAGGAMDGAVDAAAAEQRRVGRIDDGVDVERRDVGDADFEPRRADLGGQERWRGWGHGAMVAQPCLGRSGPGQVPSNPG